MHNNNHHFLDFFWAFPEVVAPAFFLASCHAKYFLKSTIDMLSVVFFVDEAFPPADAFPVDCGFPGDFLTLDMLFFPVPAAACFSMTFCTILLTSLAFFWGDLAGALAFFYWTTFGIGWALTGETTVLLVSKAWMSFIVIRWYLVGGNCRLFIISSVIIESWLISAFEGFQTSGRPVSLA